MSFASAAGALSPVISAAVASGVFVVLLVLERVRPLRIASQSKIHRFVITLGFAVTAAIAMALAYVPVVLPAVAFAERHGLGLLRWVPVPDAARAVAAFVLLDYTLWAWHWLNHRVPLLWRFHAAHHADLDLDVLTAWRFHFGEMLASVPFRAAQAVVIGVDLRLLLVWELVVLVCAQFHHSNVRLPASFERVLRTFMITPRLHAIHHSVEARDVSSNFGTISSVWDRLHRLHRWRVESPPAIGLPEIRDPDRLSAVRALALPFSRLPLRPPTVSS